MKLSRNRFYGLFTVFLFFGIILGCDFFNNSMVDYSLDNIEITRVTGLTVRTEYTMMSDGTILIPPGSAQIGVNLSNPRNFSVRQELLGVPEGKNITTKQIRPEEIEVNIDGAAEGDEYALTLAMQSPDGFRDFPVYSLRIECVSFETALQDFTVNGAVPPAFDPAKDAFQVNVPYTSTTVTFGGKSVHPEAVIEIYAGTDDSGVVLARAAHTVEITQDLVEGNNDFYVKITAPSSTVQSYAVTIYRAKDSENSITAFYFTIGTKQYGAGTGFAPENGSGSINGPDITVTVPYGTDITKMTPVVIHTGETISPVEGTERDFTNPVTYTVKAADGTSRDYTVTVNVAASDAKAITAFYFTFGGKKYGAGTGTETNSGNISGNTITITVPYGTTNLASLTPTVTHSGTLISPDGATWGSSPSPHTYTVTAEDGTSQDYTVTVNVAKIASVTAVNGNFTSPNGFVKTGSDISDEITDAITSVTGTDGLGTAITLAPADYSVDTLNPASAGANATATLRVPAAKNSTGGDITKTFTVYIKNDAKAITAFAIDSPVSAVGTIDEAAKTITVSVPYGTNVAAMTATASYTGDSISPDPAAADYTGGKTFTVTAEDGTTRTYTVTVNATPRITISGITVEGLSALTFSGVPASPVSASTSITITISGGVTVDSWHIEIKGPAPSTSPVGTFAAPPVPGFYNINVFATVGGNLYSGSFGLIVN